MLHVRVRGLSLSNMGFVVLLKSDEDSRTLPIFIGGAEAQAIALHLDRVELPRPLTHDLFKRVIDCLECRLKRIVVNDIAESTFFAVLVFERDGGEFEVDARPSDAIALALRCGAPLYVTRKVMDKAGLVIAESGDEAKRRQAEPGDDVARLQRDLEEAVRQERYEDAAALRDRIRKLQEHPSEN